MNISKEEREQARIDIRSWGADEKPELVERLLNALDEADSEKAELQTTLKKVSEVYLEITNGNISKPGTNPSVVLDYAREANEQDQADDLRMKDEQIADLQRENDRLDYMLRYIDATSVDWRLTMKANEAWLKKEERGL